MIIKKMEIEEILNNKKENINKKNKVIIKKEVMEFERINYTTTIKYKSIVIKKEGK
jgi:hypothetical protein